MGYYIKVIRSNIANFVRISSYKGDSYGLSNLCGKIMLNDEVPEQTFHPHWFKVSKDNPIDHLKYFQDGEAINRRYTLIDESLANDKIPLSIPEDQIEKDDDEWSGKYASLKSLYKFDFDRSPPQWVAMECEFEQMQSVEISNYDCPIDMKIGLAQTGFASSNDKTFESTLSKIVCYADIEKMMTPEFLLHERPCFINSETTYRIIRAWVKDHHDPVQARITSDYDFCFTVKKRVKIKPWTSRTEDHRVNGKSYRPPRFKTREITEKEIEVFEMTHDQKGYKGYTVIAPFRGNTLAELAENIKNYLDDLITEINRPIAECSHCAGTGHILGERFEVNKRTA